LEYWTTIDVDYSSAFAEEEDDTLHLTALGPSPSVGTDGKTWRRFPSPRNLISSGVSRAQFGSIMIHEVSVWVLEDYTGQEWTLNDTITGLRAEPGFLFGGWGGGHKKSRTKIHV
jgi:hypothetical protein